MFSFKNLYKISNRCFRNRNNIRLNPATKARFSHWKAPEMMIVHKNAKHHRECFKTWKELERNLSNKSRIIDAEFHVQIEKEKQKWREIREK